MTISYKELVSKFIHGKVTNKDIIRAVDYNRCLGNIDIAIDCMELARADEREKLSNTTQQPQGVEVWVSWDSSPTGYATIQSEKPFERKIVGGTSYGIRGGHCTKLTDGFAKYLGIKQGECKKFRIVEVDG